MATLAAAPIATRGARADRNEEDGLVAAARAGDDHAFEQLYLRYQRRIGAYVYGMVHDHGRAEDITQDVFMSALRRMRATDVRIAFKPWIYEIAKNACIDAFRRSRRTEEISYDADDGGDRLHLVSNGPTPDAAVDTRMSLDHLRGAFGGLSEAHHQILVMRELEGLSYRQIGERLGMSRPSVESTLFRARRRLSEEYEELVSGERCQRIQAIIAAATDGRVGTRDENKMARHVSHCQPCRRAALVAGFDPDALMPKRTAREKLAAWLPLPEFLRRRIAGQNAGDPGSVWMTAAHYVEPVSGGWMKLAAAASAVLLAGGLGANTVRSQGDKPAGGPGASAPVSSAAPTKTVQNGSTIAGHPSGGSTATQNSSQAPGTGSNTSGGGSSSSGGTAGGGGQGSGATAPTSDSAGGSNGSSGGGGSSDPVKNTTGTGGGAVGGTGSTSAPEVPTVQLPNVQVPNLPGAPKVVNDTVDTVNHVASGATGAVNNTVGQATGAVNNTVGQATGAVNDTVGQTGTAVDKTVDGVTGAVGGTTGAVGGAVGGTTGAAGGAVGGTTQAVGDTVDGVTGSSGKLLGGG
jgi:RNA polymerase sigma factor (sigma-70 family)